jgi:arabinose-5-phosphate isomerase
MFKLIKEIILGESLAIQKIADYIDYNEVIKAVELIQGCQSKLVISGVGKSGIIGKKIGATFTSLGVTSVFLHPLEALHGDLGIVSANDVVIMISNSGETAELLEILPYIKNRAKAIISIVGRENSKLASLSDVVLLGKVDKEVCPLNILPTASATVALVIGDLLAVLLMQAKSLTKEDFAINHPAGALGKRLTLKVEHIMHHGSDLPKISHDALLLDALKELNRISLGCVCVLDENDYLLGIITDGDIRRLFSSHLFSELEHLKIYDIMIREPLTILPETLAYEALNIMENNRKKPVSVIPVVNDKNVCVGVVRLHDLVKLGL